MAYSSRLDAQNGLNALRWPLRLTLAGMFAERLWQATWPLVTLCLAVLASLMFGLQDILMFELVWVFAGMVLLGGLAALIYALTQFRITSRAAALARLDETLPGRPIQALMDGQATGKTDPASLAVWRAHQARMVARVAAATPVAADLRIARHDPYALRYAAVLAFVVALVFGSGWHGGSVTDMVRGPGNGQVSGPVWEGWAESPRYTGRPTLYLNDITQDALTVPVGSLITFRFYGETGALTVAETVSGQTADPNAALNPEHDFIALLSGEIAVNGPGGRSWSVTVLPDAAPQTSTLGEPEADAVGKMSLPFEARDDYGVETGEARIALDLGGVDRQHGLTIAPDPRPEITVSLPMPVAGSRADFQENLIEDFSQHPWANLPVTITLTASDAAAQRATSAPVSFDLPGRRFFDPLAAAIIEQRRDLLWAQENATRVSQILRAISHRPNEVFRKEVNQLRLRRIITRLETRASYGLAAQQQEDLSQDLWNLAVAIEEGDLTHALDRLRRAKERLNQAMRDDARASEIDELMRELRRATEDYLDQLSRQAQQNAQQNGEQDRQGDPKSQMQMTQDDLQRMMDRIQELMEQGRMAEAEQALQELQEMLENMRVTQDEGQRGQSPGEQAMEGLAETLRDQQGLSDRAFRDLQEQFNPNAQTGENQGNEGRSGGQGRGDQHSQGGDGQGERGDGQQDGNDNQQGAGAEGSLADRQQALRDELSRQQRNLPGAGTTEGEAARDALGRAGRAMDDAEDALRQREYADALDSQSRAMDALREGMRALDEAMQQDQRNGAQGQGTADANRGTQTGDPLGRDTGSNGSADTDEGLLQGEDVYRRARDLLDEIRRRSGEGERPDVELEYLKRLLERF